MFAMRSGVSGVLAATPADQPQLQKYFDKLFLRPNFIHICVKVQGSHKTLTLQRPTTQRARGLDIGLHPAPYPSMFCVTRWLEIQDSVQGSAHLQHVLSSLYMPARRVNDIAGSVRH